MPRLTNRQVHGACRPPLVDSAPVSTYQGRRLHTRHPRRGLPSTLGRSAAAFGALVLALSVAAPALAHAELVSSSPADKAVLQAPPTSITLSFSEGLDAAKSSFKLLGGGATIGIGKAVADGAAVMSLDGLALAPGAFEIQWTSAATDGHIDRGTLTFTVATASSSGPAASSAPAASTTSVSPGATPAPSDAGATPAAASSTDVLIPIAVVLVAVAGFGAYLMRRSRRA